MLSFGQQKSYKKKSNDNVQKSILINPKSVNLFDLVVNHSKENRLLWKSDQNKERTSLIFPESKSTLLIPEKSKINQREIDVKEVIPDTRNEVTPREATRNEVTRNEVTPREVTRNEIKEISTEEILETIRSESKISFISKSEALRTLFYDIVMKKKKLIVFGAVLAFAVPLLSTVGYSSLIGSSVFNSLYFLLKSFGIEMGSKLSLSLILLKLKKYSKNGKITKGLGKGIFGNKSKKMLKTLGVPSNFTESVYEDLLTSIVQNSISLSTGDFSSFIISKSVSVGSSATKIGAQSFQKQMTKMSEVIKSIPNTFCKTVMEVKKSNPAKIVMEVSKKIENELPKGIDVKEEKSNLERSDIQKLEKEKTLEDVSDYKTDSLKISNLKSKDSYSLPPRRISKTTSMGIGIAATLTTAIMSGKLDISILDSDISRKIGWGILVKSFGIDGIIERFGKWLTVEQINKIKILNGQIGLLKKESIIGSSALYKDIFQVLYGQIYNSDELKEMNIRDLRDIVVKKNLISKTSATETSKNTLISLIKKQQEKLQQITYQMLVAGATEKIVSLGSTVLGGIAAENIAQGIYNSDMIISAARLVPSLSELEISSLELINNIGINLIDTKDNLYSIAIETVKKIEKWMENPIGIREEDPVMDTPVTSAPIEIKEDRYKALRDELRRKANIIIEKRNEKNSILGEPVIVTPPSLSQFPEILTSAFDYEFTPLLKRAAIEVTKSTNSWIPGIGLINKEIQAINTKIALTEGLVDFSNIISKAGKAIEELEGKGFDFGEAKYVADVLKKFSKIPEFKKKINVDVFAGIDGGMINMGIGESLRNSIKAYIPSLSSLVDTKEVDLTGFRIPEINIVPTIADEKVNLRDIIFSSLQEKLVNGISDYDFYKSIAKGIAGAGEIDKIESITNKFMEMAGNIKKT